MISEDSVSKDGSHTLRSQLHVSSFELHCFGKPIHYNQDCVIALTLWYGSDDVNGDHFPWTGWWLEWVEGGSSGGSMGFCSLTRFASFNINSDILLKGRPPVVT